MDNAYENKGKLDKAALDIDFSFEKLVRAARLLEVERDYSKSLEKILEGVIEER